MIYAVNIVNDHKICDRVSSPIAHGSVCLKIGIVRFKIAKKNALHGGVLHVRTDPNFQVLCCWL